MASAAHKVDISWDRRPAGVVAHVVFDNARRLNVLNPPALLDLTEAFQSLAREDDLRVVVFSGAGGKAFIGGADINHMVTMKTSEDGRRFITMVHKLCQSIRDCPGAGHLPRRRLRAGRRPRSRGGLRPAHRRRQRPFRHARGQRGRPVGGRGGAAAAPDRLGPHVAPAADRRDHRRRQGRGAGAWSRRSCRRRSSTRRSSAA